MPTTLELGPSPTPTRRRGVNWTALGVIVALILALLSYASSGARDYLALGSRVTVLETNRTNDTQRMERIENKVDRILERLSEK